MWNTRRLISGLCAGALCGALALAWGCGEEELGAIPEKLTVNVNEPQLESNPPQLNLLRFGDLQDRFAANSALQRDTFTQKVVSKVDILWVVDNSGSMLEEQEKLARNFDAFIQFLIQTNVDYHIGVVTTDVASSSGGKLYTGKQGTLPPYLTPNVCAGNDCAALFGQLVSVGTTGSPIEKGLDAAVAALSTPVADATPNKDFLRDDANLAIIVVSDEEDSSFAAAISYYVRFFEGLKTYGNGDEVTVSAIAGADPNTNQPANCITQNASGGAVGQECPTGGGCGAGTSCQTLISGIKICTQSCSPGVPGQCPTGYSCVADQLNPALTYCTPDAVAVAGRRYFDVAQGTGGVFQSICAPDFNVALNSLGFTVSGLKREFTLTRAPRKETILVTVTPPTARAAEWQSKCPGMEAQPFVDCATAPGDAWCYDDAKRAIVFTTACLPIEQSIIEVSYRVAGQ